MIPAPAALRRPASGWRTGRTPGAGREVEQAMERNHFEAELQALRNQLLTMGGMVEERVHRAVQALIHRRDDEAQRALGQSHGSEPAIELLLAQAQTAVGKFEDSAETLRTFLRLHPDDKGAATARRWLERLTADGKVRK